MTVQLVVSESDFDLNMDKLKDRKCNLCKETEDDERHFFNRMSLLSFKEKMDNLLIFMAINRNCFV